ncbi:MAG: hypothetical protein ACRBBR_05990 [Cellvibrionaceae bacterium]
MKTSTIPGATRKSSILFVIAITTFFLCIVSFIAMYYHLYMLILAAVFFIIFIVAIKASQNIKLVELRCKQCGWSNQT